MFSKARNILDSLNRWEVIWWLFWRLSHNLNGLLFNNCISLHVHRVDDIVTVGVLIVLNLIRWGCYQCGVGLKPFFWVRGTQTIGLTEGTTSEVNIVFWTHDFLCPGALRRAELHYTGTIYIYYWMVTRTLIFNVSQRWIKQDLIIGSFFISGVSNFTESFTILKKLLFFLSHLFSW